MSGRIKSRVKTERPGGTNVPPNFWLPLADSGSGAVNVTLASGSGSATFTRAGATATTVLSTGLISSAIAANTARSYYDPAPTGGQGSYMYLPGVSGAYASTPDSAAVSVTGDIDIRAQVALDDWTPAAATSLVSKYDAAGNQQSYLFQVLATGNLALYSSLNGSASSLANSGAATGVADGAIKWLRVTRASSTGAVNFYTSDDGSTWTQLGTQQTSTAGSLFDGTAPLQIGAFNAGGIADLLKGRVYRAQLYNGINGTLVADFDPARTTQASTSFAATTGETWTVNGRGYIYAAPSYRGYLAEEARTNLVLRSSDFSLAWTAVGTPTRSAAAKTCGSVNLDLIGDDSAAALEGYTQTITYTGNATKVVSLFVAQGTSTSTMVRLRDTTAVADRLLAAITWSAGAPTLTMTTGTSLGAQPFPDGVWRVSFLTAAVTAANVNSLEVYPASDAALAVANTGDIYAGGVESNDAAFSTSHIPTAASTVTRNADVLTYPSAGNVLDTVGTCAAKLSSFWTATTVASMAVAIEDLSGRAIYVGAAAASTTTSIFDGTNVTNAAGLPDMSIAQRQRASRWGGSSVAVGSNTSLTAGSFDGNMGAGGTTNIGIGCSPVASGNDWNGCIRDVRIWQRVLSDSQIASIL